MLRHLATATAVSALLIGGAAAQTPAPDAGKTTPPAASSTPSATQQTMGGAPVTSQQPDQWVASKFNGTDVLGPDNQKVGDISDILFDQNGQISAYIISVGGFLGMGSKEIALPPSAFQVVSGEAARPATTGAGTSTTPPAAAASNEKKLKISMTQEQLKQAPAFEYYKEPSRAATGAAPGPATRPAMPGGAGPSGNR
jgi:hypothetical protein